MRITNNILRDNALANIRRGLDQIGVAQQRVSTGVKLERASDDPAGATTAMATRGSLRAIDQYRRGIESARLRSTTEEAALEQVEDLLVRARTLGMSQATISATPHTRAMVAREVDDLLRHAVTLSRTELNGSYLFGGASAAAPFEIDSSGANLDFTTASPSGDFELEISAQVRVITNHNGSEVFGTTTSGVLASLRDLSAALNADDSDAILTSLNSVSSSLAHVQSLTIETGVRQNHLDVTGANLDAMEMSLLSLKSSLEDVDMEEAVTELMSRQTTFQAAMLATSRVIGLTLTDYLR